MLIFKAANDFGPFICILKIHVASYENFDLDKMFELRRVANTHNFLIFEDKKFYSLDETEINQDVYKTLRWADLINFETITGPFNALKKVSLNIY